MESLFSTIDNATGLNIFGTTDGKPKSKTIFGSFRDVKFNCESNKLEFGRRVALHEFPQFDKPFSQDMGKVQYKYEIPCWIAGPDWKKQRDDLITACNTAGVGKLIHPQFGELMVQPGSCSCTENHLQSYGRVDFDLTFYESIETDWHAIKVSAQSKIQSSAFARIMKIAGELGTIYNQLTTLPAYAASYVSTMATSLMGGLGINQIVKSVQAFTDFQQLDITQTLPVFAGVTQFTASINNDYSALGTELYVNADSSGYTKIDPDLEEPTNMIDATTANSLYNQIVNRTVSTIIPNSDATTLQYKCGKALELFIKSVAVIEQSVAVSLLPIDNLSDAQKIWNELLNNYDALIQMAADTKQDVTWLALREHRALVVEDLQNRAPSLAKLLYIDIDNVVPSLVLAYEQYENIDRSTEIVARNSIIHPSFIQGHNIELLNV